MTKIKDSTLLKKSDDLLEAPMEESLALMSIEEGKYYGMNPVAKYIWKQLDEPISYQLLIQKILAKYEVDKTTCQTETQSFINDLLSRKMIHLNNE